VRHWVLGTKVLKRFCEGSCTVTKLIFDQSIAPIIVLGDFGGNTVADLDVFHQLAVSNYLRAFSGAIGPSG